MSLVACIECKKNIGSLVKTCPNCGTKQKIGSFSWWALFFPPIYYFGYGKIFKGLLFFILFFIPLFNIFICIYAGFNAKKNLDVRNKSFNWYKASIPIALILILCFLYAIGSENIDNKSNVGNTNITQENVNNNMTFGLNEPVRTEKFEITIISVSPTTMVGNEYLNSKPAEGGIYLAVKWKYKNISNKPIGTFSFPTLSLFDAQNIEYSNDIDASGNYATQINSNEKIISDLNPGIAVTSASVFEIDKKKANETGLRFLVRGDHDVWFATTGSDFD